jgi:hypothetical protein
MKNAVNSAKAYKKNKLFAYPRIFAQVKSEWKNISIDFCNLKQKVGLI